MNALQDRLLTPPRVARFCPTEHCARHCGPDNCTCAPCPDDCPHCVKRRARAAMRTPDLLPALKPCQPHLFR